MHYDSEQWETQTATSPRDNPEISGEECSKTQQSDVSSTSSVRIPIDLRQYLTTTSQPNEIYSKLRESREKRLRLLLRRFTNQIQFGCKNPFCTVESCFSNRRRRSDVPVRPYTDVAARALAWRHVEDYASNTDGTISEAIVRHPNKSKHRKELAPYERGNGLCWSEPVIPWYADPREYISKRRSQYAHSTVSDKPTTQANGFVGNMRTLSTSVPSSTNGPASKISPLDNCTNDVESRHSRRAHSPDRSIDARRGETGKENGDMQLPCLVIASVDAASVRDHVLEPPKDTASFSQSLYDTIAVKKFGTGAQSKSDDTTPAGTRHSHGCSNRDASCKEDTVRDKHEREAPMKETSESCHTFGILNEKVMSWLMALVVQRRNDKISFDDESAPGSVSVASLTRQSLHYCLSHPHRLLQCAEAWRTESASTNEQNDVATDSVQVGLNTHKVFLPTGKAGQSRSTATLLPNVRDVVKAFDLLSCMQPYSLILNSVFAALQHAYILPPALQRQPPLGSHKAVHGSDSVEKRSNKIVTTSTSSSTFISDQQAASLCMIGVFCLINVSAGCEEQLELPIDPGVIASFNINHYGYRHLGRAFPHAFIAQSIDRRHDPLWRDRYLGLLQRIDAHDDFHVFRLLEGLADVISHRLGLHSTMKTLKTHGGNSKQDRNIIDFMIDLSLQCQLPDPALVSQPAWFLIDLMTILLSKRWNKKPTIQKRSSVGGALEMLAGLYRNRTKIGISSHSFTLRFVAESLDSIKMPIEWLSFREDSKQTHILSYSFLFHTVDLVKYFRAINVEAMRRSYEYASVNQAYAKNFLQHKHITVYGVKDILADLRPHMARQFVLTIRRQHILEDSIDQIWRRQHQELMRPLKVSLGKHEGEDGLDHGGVQQEYFRMLFAEALDVSHGVFTIDSQTHMTWFQPGSLEPLYKIEAVGVLMSLAVYNAVTLPITFPLAFYRKLLGLKVKRLEHIEDGWPELTKGLRTMQTWSDGDVGDVMSRTYEFSYRIFDSEVTVDMSKVKRRDQWPDPQRRRSKDKGKTATFGLLPLGSDEAPATASDLLTAKLGTSINPRNPVETMSAGGVEASAHERASSYEGNHTEMSRPSPVDEPPLVTNKNRDQYIKDYIFWLTDKSISPQFDAFYKGFHTCLDSTALSIFTPEALKKVVEGETEIDIDGLEASVTYDEFQATDQFIIDLWSIIRDMSPKQHKQLLEFVTASDRIPVTGISSVTFIIQKNGESDERLPSSSTCYGRLLLPKYSTKEILRAKLEKAIENSIGFGTL